MATLAIIWRNPKQVRNQRRCRQQEQIGGRTLYVVQQRLSDERDIWVNTSTFFEVISNRGVPTSEPQTRKWHFGLGW
jgi:hypothetical protein